MVEKINNEAKPVQKAVSKPAPQLNENQSEELGDAERQEEEQRQQALEEQKAQEEKDERRKSLVEEITKSPEGFVAASDSNRQAIDEAMAEGAVYMSNVQRGPVEVEERYFLTASAQENHNKFTHDKTYQHAVPGRYL